MITVPPEYCLGVDIGSTAIKAVVLRPSDAAPIWSRYVRHESRPAQRLLEILQQLEAETGAGPGNCHAFATGSGAATLAPLFGARLVQEVAATVLAAERRYPRVGTVVELGGQDAKIVVFERDQGHTRRIVSMNDKCAGGTGAVIDKIAAKLKIPPDTLQDLAFAGRTIYPIAGKCGVFAETDINGLQKRGVPAEELMASLFDAIVVQNLAVLARGQALRPPVLLLGGPHAFIRGLADAWRTHLVRVWRERGVALLEESRTELVVVPPHAALFGALGAIELGQVESDNATRYCGAAQFAGALSNGAESQSRRGAPSIARAGMDLEEFRRQFAALPWTPPAPGAGTTVRGFIGLDAGSTSTKAVVLNESGEVLAKSYELSRGNPIEDAIGMFRALRGSIESQGATLEVAGLVTTGYAKDTLKEVFRADAALVETIAHAHSAMQLYDDPHVIVDVGGQDIKIVVLRDGRVTDFRLNTQCSAGNGYFLQAIASTFGIPVESFAEAAFSAAEMPVFSYGCVLFLQSEIAAVQRRGWRPEEILAGLAAVLPRNVFLYVAHTPNLARLGRRFVLQGGTQRNLAAVKAEVDFIRESFRGQDQEPEILLHPHAGEAGAIGAALEAIRLCGDRRTTFVGLDVAERTTFSARSSEQTRCHYCTNECLRTFIDVHVDGAADRQLVVASCEKGAAEDLGAVRQIAKEVSAVKARTPNLVAMAAREVWKPTRPPLVADARRRFNRRVIERRSALRIGIPRVFNMYALAPLFSGYLESLGVSHIVYSDFTTTELYREGSGRGAIDPCFPSKVALGHVHNLLHVKQAKQPLDAIFFPMIDVLPPRFTHVVGSNACPTVALTPQTLRAAFTKHRDEFADRAFRYLDPLLNLADRPLLERQMYETWHRLLGLSRPENERAIASGFAALSAYDTRIRQAAREALDAIEADGRIGIVLLGRVYHHDPGLNHGIAEELQKLGYPVFSQATLPLDADLLDRLFGDEVRQGIIADPLDIHDVWKPSFSASSNAKVWAAKFAARHPSLAVVELSNFKCGHDAPIYATVESIVESSGTPYFAFKDIDENRPAASIKLRLETLHYALGRHRERMMARRRAEARVQRALTRYEARLRRAVRPGSPAAEPEDAPAGVR